MVESTEDGDTLEISVGIEDDTGQGPGGEVLGTTLGSTYRSKLRYDEGPGLTLSGISYGL